MKGWKKKEERSLRKEENKTKTIDTHSTSSSRRERKKKIDTKGQKTNHSLTNKNERK
jgi:hypothetical protein